MLELIATVAMAFHLEVGFVQAIALTENTTLSPTAIHKNVNGTIDYGLMQLNSSWYDSDKWMEPESNVNAACRHIAGLMGMGLNYWEAAVAYNCGYARFATGRPPDKSIDYANRVFDTWHNLDPRLSLGGRK